MGQVAMVASIIILTLLCYNIMLQLVLASSNHIGCGTFHCQKPVKNLGLSGKFLVCSYSPGSVPLYCTYTVAVLLCFECHSLYNTTYKLHTERMFYTMKGHMKSECPVQSVPVVQTVTTNRTYAVSYAVSVFQ